jgi:hypothetical protein
MTPPPITTTSAALGGGPAYVIGVDKEIGKGVIRKT